MGRLSYEAFANYPSATGLWFEAKDIPQDLQTLMMRDASGFSSFPDYLTPLKKGKVWLFDLLRVHQPRTGSALQGGGELFIRSTVSESGSLNFSLGMRLSDRVVLFGRDFCGMNPTDEDYSRPVEARAYSLPEPLRLAYYARFDGLNIPDSEAIGIATRLLPFPVNRPWTSWNRYLEEFKGYKGIYLTWLAERIPGVAPQRKGAPWTNFMAFLDTRPTLSGKEGDVLFVKNHIQDGVVYWVCGADIENMRVLADPVAALDLYCEHVLLGRAGRFDFTPFSAPMP